MHLKPAYYINFFISFQFYIRITRVGTPINDHAHPTFFNELLIPMDLDQYAKNHAFSSFCSRNILDLKILRPY